jgi:molybdopterin synthase sulfur carrier subunit
VGSPDIRADPLRPASPRLRSSPDEPGGLHVTVRYFAAAQAAAGVDSETITLPASTTVAELVKTLAGRGDRLAGVLDRCSYLRNEVAIRDETMALSCGDTIDVLPPFAGG